MKVLIMENSISSLVMADILSKTTGAGLKLYMCIFKASSFFVVLLWVYSWHLKSEGIFGLTVVSSEFPKKNSHKKSWKHLVTAL